MAERLGSSWPLNHIPARCAQRQSPELLRANKDKEVWSGLGWEELWGLGGVANSPRYRTYLREVWKLRDFFLA